LRNCDDIAERRDPVLQGAEITVHRPSGRPCSLRPLTPLRTRSYTSLQRASMDGERLSI
jgi:hypothetical protein